VAVNISTRQWQERGFVHELRRILSASGLAGAELELEITESLMLEPGPRLLRRFREVREMGIRLAVDDFGTGYSSLGYLKRYPVDAVKIDRSFVRELGRGQSSDAALVRAIVAMGHGLGLAVVAEGVEQYGQWETLRALGCDLGQGYLFARPLPAEAFAAWLQRHADGVVVEVMPLTGETGGR